MTRLGLFPPQGSYFLLYMQRIALYSQVGLNPVYIKEIEHLFCTFFSSFASQRVLGKSINKDPALFSLCGWGFRQGNPSMTGLTVSVGSEFNCEWHTGHTLGLVLQRREEGHAWPLEIGLVWQTA